jgi:hypothetical protein
MTGDPIRMGITTLVIPPRRDPNMTGSAFAKRMKEILGDTLTLPSPELARRSAQVEELVYQQFNSGNIPDFMRPENFPTIKVEKTIEGRKYEVSLKVCPDYLAIGTNDNYIIVPVSAVLAQRIADRFDLALPTQKLVDILDDEAKRTRTYVPFFAAPKLAESVINPHTNKPAIEGEMGKKWSFQQYGHYEGRWMLSGQFVEEQSRLINQSVRDGGNLPGIRSGHKKDVIYDPFNFTKAREGGQPVIIYHRPVQGLSYQHNVGYLDYSHGIRFLSNYVDVTITEKDGSKRTETMKYTDLLNDAKLYQLVSHGRVDTSRIYRNQPIPLVDPPAPKKKEAIPQ